MANGFRAPNLSNLLRSFEQLRVAEEGLTRRKEAKRARESRARAAHSRTIGTVLGTVAGGIAGGPGGAVAGSQIGSTLGGLAASSQGDGEVSPGEVIQVGSNFLARQDRLAAAKAESERRQAALELAATQRTEDLARADTAIQLRASEREQDLEFKNKKMQEEVAARNIAQLIGIAKSNREFDIKDREFQDKVATRNIAELRDIEDANVLKAEGSEDIRLARNNAFERVQNLPAGEIKDQLALFSNVVNSRGSKEARIKAFNEISPTQKAIFKQNVPVPGEPGKVQSVFIDPNTKTQTPVKGSQVASADIRKNKALVNSLGFKTPQEKQTAEFVLAGVNPDGTKLESSPQLVKLLNERGITDEGEVNKYLDLAIKKATTPNSRRIQSDGQGGFIYTEGALTGLGIAPVNQVQKDIINQVGVLEALDSVDASFNKDSLTIPGKIKLFGLSLMDIGGLDLDDEDVAAITADRQFKTKVKSFFQAYRKAVTGAQASDKELKALEETVINMKQGPKAFKATLDTLRSESKRTIRLKNRILRENKGIKQFDAKGKVNPKFAKILKDMKGSSPWVVDKKGNIQILNASTDATDDLSPGAIKAQGNLYTRQLLSANPKMSVEDARRKTVIRMRQEGYF